VTGTVVDQIPEQWRTLFVTTLQKRAPIVFQALRATSWPSPDDAQYAVRMLTKELHELEDDDPTKPQLEALVDHVTRQFLPDGS
jgi:DNA-binding HxlR family transcriptional regulator